MSTRDGISIRATRRVVRFLFWKTGAFTFDAKYLDGRIENNVDLDEVLDTAKYPADAWDTRHGAMDQAGDHGEPGRWVVYPWGRPVDDDQSPNPAPSRLPAERGRGKRPGRWVGNVVLVLLLLTTLFVVSIFAWPAIDARTLKAEEC